MSEVVPATMVKGVYGNSDLSPGSFCYSGALSKDGRHGMMFKCPCGCGSIGNLRFDSIEEDPDYPCWAWDGVVEKPTLHPSVQRTDGCKWHGHLIAGEWIPV
jgi:hypothetical protein